MLNDKTIKLNSIHNLMQKNYKIEALKILRSIILTQKLIHKL
jgi:hypothetical protein